MLCRFIVRDDHTPRTGLLRDGDVFDLSTVSSVATIDQMLAAPVAELRARLGELVVERLARFPAGDFTLLAPVESQEVWACGVTYERSRDARIRESTLRDVYDRVYDAERPELFFKATPSRVVGPGARVAIRADSTWDVPEPELAVVLNSALEIVGYTIGNDVSSRSIEGENPLYLPQAKVYGACCAIGPSIVPAWELPEPHNLAIRLVIARHGETLVEAETSTSRLHRNVDELIGYLGRDNVFPNGVLLLTGTGIVPGDDFSLAAGDSVRITIDGIGTLENAVRRGV